jgi:hypothetical protein
MATSTSMLFVSGAHAAGPTTTSPSVLQEAWFWQNAYEQANPPVAEAPPATEPKGVPDGDLAVAFTQPGGTSSSKMTALSFDVGSVPSGSTVSDFTFSLTLDSDNPLATSFDTQGATVVACQPTRGWPAEMGGDYTDEPSVNCANAVKPKIDGDTYTFSIPAIAQSWIDDQNLGVAVVADPTSSAAPFQLVFKGAKAVKAKMTVDSAAATSTTTTPATTSVPPASGAPPVSGGVDSGPSVPLPADSTGSAAGPAAAPPVVASAAPATAPVTAPVAAVKPAPTAPGTSFWIAAIVFGAVILAASLVLGDAAPVTAGAGATTSRLDRVLRHHDADVFTVRSL